MKSKINLETESDKIRLAINEYDGEFTVSDIVNISDCKVTLVHSLIGYNMECGNLNRRKSKGKRYVYWKIKGLLSKPEVKKGRKKEKTDSWDKIRAVINNYKGEFTAKDIIGISQCIQSTVCKFLKYYFDRGDLYRKKIKGRFVYGKVEKNLERERLKMGEASDMVFLILRKYPDGLSSKEIVNKIKIIYMMEIKRYTVSGILNRWFLKGYCYRVDRGVYRLKKGLKERPVTSSFSFSKSANSKK
jgi:hypothetical protein